MNEEKRKEKKEEFEEDFIIFTYIIHYNLFLVKV